MTLFVPPASGEVHVRLFSLDRSDEERERLEQFLSPEEMTRAERMLSRKNRDRFVAGRGLLREILAGYLGHAPGNIKLAAGEHGKPYVADGNGQSWLRFNLSHTGGKAIVALAAHREVGVDLELCRDNLPFAAMARRFYAPREQAELFSLPVQDQLAAFYLCWTRKEAYIKACGTGFSQPADGFAVSLLPGVPSALTAHAHLPDEPKRWSLIDLPVPGNRCAALAIEGNGAVVRYSHHGW